MPKKEKKKPIPVGKDDKKGKAKALAKKKDDKLKKKKKEEHVSFRDNYLERNS